jgi:hypothetical protein
MIDNMDIVICINCFIIGYLLGKNSKIDQNNGVYNQYASKKSTTDNNSTKIHIDERKVVSEINTKGLEKKYSEIGEDTVSKEDISNSINKLKNIKK